MKDGIIGQVHEMKAVFGAWAPYLVEQCLWIPRRFIRFDYDAVTVGNDLWVEVSW